MRKELHVSHIPQPPKPVTVPLSSKKKQKNNKKKTRTAHFLGYHMDWKDRNVTDIYSFETNPLLCCQGDSDDVIGSKNQHS